MKANQLRALVAAPIYASLHQMHNALSEVDREACRLSSLDYADRLLEVADERLEDPESDTPPASKAGDPFFVIHPETCKAISTPDEAMPPHPVQWTNMGDRGLYDAIEQIDASMFSSDAIQSLEAIRYLEWHIGRWVRELKATRDGMVETQAEAPKVAPPRHYPSTYPKKCGICDSTEHDTEACQEDIPF